MKIGDAAVQFLNGYADANYGVWYGDPYTCHEIATLAQVRENAKTKHGAHPLNVITKVINALEGDSRFEKSYVRAHRGLWRLFELKPEYRTHDTAAN